MPPTVLALLADRHDGRPVLTVRGELDVGTAPALRTWLRAATRNGSRSAVVDLSAVTFMAVAALHVLRDEHERLAKGGHRLTIVTQNPQLLALFELAAVGRGLVVVPARPPELVPRLPVPGGDELPPAVS